MSSCGCCACLEGAGQPVPSFNRPGLSAIKYRAGTHATFIDAMIRRLTVPVRPAPNGYSLHKLTTRETDDASIAMLDAWATSADVLTFYQERIANEGYLRTATERRSMIELGRLVGYTLKPGVAASVYLAYTLEDGAKTIIPAGAKAQSIPGPDEQPQTFETSEEIEARAEWNALRPRMRRPQRMNVDRLIDVPGEDDEPEFDLLDNVLDLEYVWIEGTNTVLEKREPLLFVFKGDLLTEPVFAIRRVLRTVLDTERDRTQVFLEKIRPYYRKLFLAALIALHEGRTSAVVRKPIPVPPDPDNSVPIFLEAEDAPKSKKKKSKKNKEADSASELAHATPVPAIADLLREILNGTTRTVLQDQFTGIESLFITLLAAVDNPAAVPAPEPATVGQLVSPLLAARADAPRNPFFARSLATTLGERSDAFLRVLTAFRPELATTLRAAIANVGVGNKLYDQFRNLYVLRRQASVFGYNAPDVLVPATAPANNSGRPIADPAPEDDKLLYLDVADDKIAVGSRAVIRNARGTRVAEVREVEVVARSAYGISNRVSRLTVDISWLESNAKMPDDIGKIQKRLDALRHNLERIRGTTILAQSEELKIAQQPLDRPIGKKRDVLVEREGEESEFRIELDTVVDGLGAGRWVIVRGERLISGTSGVVSAELAMIANVEQQTDVGAGGTTYSILELAPDGLAYEYKRETVEVLANVVPATHGETRAAILGSGSASTPMQTFTLQHTPLTFVAAPTIDGVRSTLAVRIDDALWQETGSLALAGPTDRVYATKTADDGKVTLIFGDGIHGQRIFTGNDNVRAVYRNGIGPEANVRAGQIATAITRPVNLKDVINPIEASGGAGPESARDARKNIPVSLQAMGRVVSVNDFADFARTFAGISKATAKVLAAAGTRFVHLTIGGTNDITILKTSDLYRNLVESLRKYGDPYQPFVVAVRAKLVIAGQARVKVHPDHLWSLVAPKVRAALLDTFSYDRREFGQPVFPAEVIAAIQKVPGVDYVDLDELKPISEEDARRAIGDPTVPFTVTTATGAGRQEQQPDCDEGRAIIPRFAKVPEPIPGKPGPFPQDSLPAEIAYLPPALADLFILTEIKND